MKSNQQRIIALVIDLLIISQIIVFVERFVNLTVYSKTVHYADVVIVQKFTLDFIFILLYFFTFDIFASGVTLGKQLMKIKVLKNDLVELTVAESLFRTLLKFISLVLLPFSAAAFLISDKVLQDVVLKSTTVSTSKQ